ncbi:Lrp/AsnC family transcriptional regulator [Hoeflea sp.]|uniref:Lrp/AsnC family transcriptional regulator n=1 Tax=Hoeflea sp. TaxID=1940281 RepID=UPI003B51A5C4
MTSIKLDDRDIKILAILSREGRISKSELAKRVNLSPTPCWERLRRLEEAGIISGYHANIELRHLGPQVSVFVMAELDNHKSSTFQAFEQAVASYDEIVSCWALGGGYDYLLHVITRDIDSYQRLVDDLLARRAGLSRYFTYIVTKPVKHCPGPPFDALLPSGPETD